MARAAVLLLCVLPVVLSSVVPALDPALQGNKRRVAFRILQRVEINERRFGACKELVLEWEKYDGGFRATFQAHGEMDPVVKNWGFELEFDRELTELSAFDAVVAGDVTSGKEFVLTDAGYNAVTLEGQFRKFEILGKYDSDVAPKLVRIVQVFGKKRGEEISCAAAEEGVDEVSGVEIVDEDDEEEGSVASKGTKHTYRSWPKKVMSLYILLADDDEEGYESDSDSWTPELYDWQQESSNVLFFTFIHPATMEVPPAFQKLAKTRGSGAPGSIPKDTFISFAIGGYAYSIKPNPWEWLTTREKAEAMAEKVATWPDLYGCDGIDLDLEEGAGAKKEAGPNMIHFIRKLKELQPNLVITQPTYGYPQVQAETDVINASWDTEGNSQGLADCLGLMVYEGTQALNYVKNYHKGSEQWEGFPIKINAPKSAILLGAKGSASQASIVKLAEESMSQGIRGIMVWYASVKNGFQYAKFWDASTSPNSIEGYKQAMQILKKGL